MLCSDVKPELVFLMFPGCWESAEREYVNVLCKLHSLFEKAALSLTIKSRNVFKEGASQFLDRETEAWSRVMTWPVCGLRAPDPVAATGSRKLHLRGWRLCLACVRAVLQEFCSFLWERLSTACGFGHPACAEGQPAQWAGLV